jgi:hypothetical protein
MGTKIEITISELKKVLPNTLKGIEKRMGNATNVVADISLHNWHNGFGKNAKWAYTEVECDHFDFIIKEKEVTDEMFVRILNDALAVSKVRGKVIFDTYGGDYWTPKQTYFRRLEIFAKPCKEFISLVKYIEKYAQFTLGDTDIFFVNVCGKRTSWSDSGKYRYLCYYADRCKKILADMRKYRGSKDTLKVEVNEFFSHGDDTDYKIAMYRESEWYGCRGSKLIISIKTPSGKEKHSVKWSVRSGLTPDTYNDWEEE